jgi:hypothetical protein
MVNIKVCIRKLFCTFLFRSILINLISFLSIRNNWFAVRNSVLNESSVFNFYDLFFRYNGFRETKDEIIITLP